MVALPEPRVQIANEETENLGDFVQRMRTDKVGVSADRRRIVWFELVGASYLLFIIRSIWFVRHDLRTAHAGRLALLTKPAASRTNLAGGQRVDHRWNAINDPLSQSASVTLEMLAVPFRAGRRDAVEFGRLGRSRQGKQLVGNRQSLGEIADPVRLRRARHHAEDSCIVVGCLRARAVDLSP
jgi:hypothetical protein